MANLDRLVNVVIALRTTGVAKMSFSDLLLVGTHTNSERVVIITAADDLLTGFGLTDTSPLYLAAQVAFSQTPHVRQVFIGRAVSGETPAQTMSAIKTANNNWYGFADTAHDATNIPLFAAWAEANEKLFGSMLLESQTSGTGAGNVANVLMTGNYFRTPWWLGTAASYPEVAMMSKKFTINPGGETWANTQLSAVPSPAITETLFNTVKGYNGNTYEPFRNFSISQIGKVAGGEWIDVIRFRDWLCEEVRVNVVQKMIDARIPYIDEGILIIEQGMREALDLGVTRGGIAPPQAAEDGRSMIPSYSIIKPLRSSIPPNTVANRVLQDMKFKARLAGAIHAVEISGELTYDNIA